MKTTPDENHQLYEAKMAFLKHADTETFTDLYAALRDATVWVPAERQEQGDEVGFCPLLLQEGLLGCFSCRSEAEKAALPEGASMERFDFQDFLQTAVEAECGFYLDPFTAPMGAFDTVDKCRDLKRTMFPEPEVRDLSELIMLKQRALAEPGGRAEMEFLTALMTAEVYLRGLAHYSPEDEVKMRGAKVGDVVTSEHPVRYTLDTVKTEQGECVAVYLSKLYFPSVAGVEKVDAVPEYIPGLQTRHYLVRRERMANLIARYRQAERIVGLIIDPGSPTGSLCVWRETLQLMDENPLRRVTVVYRDLSEP